MKNFINGLSTLPPVIPPTTNGGSHHDNSEDRDVIEISPRSGRTITNNHKPEKLWTCRSCTFAANPEWAKACDMCARKRTSDAAASASADNDIIEDDDDIKVYDTTLDKNVYDYARIWTCKKCTYINFGKDKRCELCNSSRNSKNKQATNNNSDPLRNKWLCRSCSYLNEQSADRCLSCSTPKEEKSSSKPAATATMRKSSNSKEWTCEICAHKNTSKTNVCELCENNVENILNDDEEERRSSINPYDNSNTSSSNGGDYYNSTMNPSLTYRSQKAMSTLKTYANATNQAEKIWKNIVKYCKEHVIIYKGEILINFQVYLST